MKLSAPKVVTFWIAVIIAVLGVLGLLGVAPLAGYAVWFLLVAFVVLALGNLVKGL